MLRLNDHPRDAVSDVLRLIDVRSVVYCLSELREPWGFAVEGAHVAKFHLVLEGSCWLELDDGGLTPLSAGELAILPHGEGHVVRDQPDSPVRGLDRILEDQPVGQDARLVYGGSGALTRLLCGGFWLAEPMPATVTRLLPALLRLDVGAAGLAAWLEPMFALLAHETHTRDPGAATVFAKIADVFLTQALRTYLIGCDRTGLLSLEPLVDPSIAGAVALVHERPAHPWTVALLAREAGMSRTSFSTKFRARVGDSPMAYLARVRLGLAAGHLATSTAGVGQVARMVGYDNDASLSKAFRREFGMAPGEYRHRTLSTRLISSD